MKRFLACGALLLCLNTALAQFEIKTNAFTAIGGFLEVSPEITLGEHSAAGVSLGFEYSSRDNSLKQDGLIYANWSVIPYYRLYFGKNESSSGFFVEPHLAIFEYEDDFSDLFETRFGAGLAIGSKFILKNNWLSRMVCRGRF